MTDRQAIVLELSYAELLHVHAAIQRDREATRKAIRRGVATAADLQATDALSERLGVMFFSCAPRTSALLPVRAVPPSGTGAMAVGHAGAHPAPRLISETGGAL